jgi:hypothetical protein
MNTLDFSRIPNQTKKIFVYKFYIYEHTLSFSYSESKEKTELMLQVTASFSRKNQAGSTILTPFSPDMSVSMSEEMVVRALALLPSSC